MARMERPSADELALRHAPGAPDPAPADSDDNPEAIEVEIPPVSGTHRYLPALDGLRALAVAGVIAYHFGFHWADGGYLGVDFFFVLSGFLITGLLAGEWGRTGSIGLRSFWGRRAKRLLPAVLFLLLVLSVYAWFGGPNITDSTFRPDAIATLFYYANWHLIYTHQSYFDQFLVPSPLRHTWSLAIEEQFYLVWPLITLVVLGAGRRARRAGRRAGGFPRRRALAVTAALGIASAVEMAVLSLRGADPSRIYYGTDTRAFELFIGAFLALLVTGRPDHPPRVRRALHVAGPVGAVVLGTLWVTAGDDAGNPWEWMYRGGLVVAGVLAAVVIASVAQPDPGPLGAALAFRPLRWLGRISYGLYLWHWPVYVLMTDVTTGLHGAALLLARLAATLAATTFSFYLIERPVRRYRWRGWPLAWSTLAAVGVTALAIVLATVPEAAATGATPDWATVRVVSPTAPPDPAPPPLTVPAGTVISPTSPLRVMTIGDSVMVDAEVGIRAALQATGEVTVSPHGFPGWGLINDSNADADLAAAVAQDHPQVVIGMWSWDNAYAKEHPARYRALLTSALDTVLAPGDGVFGVVLVEFPKVGPQDQIIDPSERQAALVAAEVNRQAWTAIARTMPAAYPGRVTFLPVASVLESHGQFTSWLPTVDGGWIRVRKTDDTHLCPAGSAVLGAAVTQQLTPMFSLPPPAPGWINPSWTDDPVRFPPSECPGDQPPSG
jgi:peptidoglycan/LPS O-acetylase OafA/YrhL